MHINIQLLIALALIPIAIGVVATTIWSRYRDRQRIAQRLQSVIPSVAVQPVEQELPSTLLLDMTVFPSTIIGAIEAGLDFVISKLQAENRRARFIEQLPDAIDLMVAVLRSGHSVAQAVQTVSNEVPNPCGEEFDAIFHRINLGQPLAEALGMATRRFRSHELDLMQRAISIQSEVGGSLAELLDKTNTTLRQRLKLSRQLKVITTQSRLSAQIVGVLPIALAIGLNFLSPGYLQLLVQDPLGRVLLCACVALEIFGLIVMQKMSTMKV